MEFCPNCENLSLRVTPIYKTRLDPYTIILTGYSLGCPFCGFTKFSPPGVPFAKNPEQMYFTDLMDE